MEKGQEPAFPVDIKMDKIFWIGSGLTKREYFAAMAMQGYLAAHAGPDVSLPNSEVAASSAVDYADALLAALEK